MEGCEIKLTSRLRERSVYRKDKLRYDNPLKDGDHRRAPVVNNGTAIAREHLRGITPGISETKFALWKWILNGDFNVDMFFFRYSLAVINLLQKGVIFK